MHVSLHALKSINEIETDEPKSIRQIRDKFESDGVIAEDNKQKSKTTFEIMKKLESDELANFFDTVGEGIENMRYYSSFNGRIFKGYVNEALALRRKTRNQNLRDFLLIIGSILAGIGTISLTVWEIYKTYFLFE